MDRATKATSISEIKGRFDKMTSAVFLDFKGMTVEEVSKLRVEFRKNGVEYRVEKAGIVHARIGKASFTEQALADNSMALIMALVRAKPSTAKGIYLRSITLTSTMGPGVKIDPGTVVSKTEDEG